MPLDQSENTINRPCETVPPVVRPPRAAGAKRMQDSPVHAGVTRQCRKVCILSSSRNATEQRMLSKEGDSLARAGFDITIVAPHSKDEVIRGIKIKALSANSSRLSRLFRATWSCYRESLHQDADVYHLHNLELIPAGWLLKLHGKRVLYDVREDTPADLRDKYWIPRWGQETIAGAVNIAEKLSARFFDGIVAATPHIGERFPASKTVVVQNFPLVDESVPSSTSYLKRSPVVLYIGTITPVRGLLQLIDAMGLLPRQIEAQLTIGGEFTPPELEQQARSSPGWIRTEYKGWQDRRGLLDLLSRARIGVVPFLSASNHTDCQPTKLFEYMRAGLPVVATNLQRVGEVIQKVGCGILVPPGDAQAMAEAIAWLLEHPAEAHAMGDLGRQAILQTYNWNSEEQRLLQFYCRLTA